MELRGISTTDAENERSQSQCKRNKCQAREIVHKQSGAKWSQFVKPASSVTRQSPLNAGKRVQACKSQVFFRLPLIGQESATRVCSANHQTQMYSKRSMLD